MATSAKDLYEQALTLSEKERADLANLIFESLEPVDEAAEEAWDMEIRKRVSELEAGTVKTLSWDAVHAKLAAKLN